MRQPLLRRVLLTASAARWRANGTDKAALPGDGSARIAGQVIAMGGGFTTVRPHVKSSAATPRSWA